MGVGVVSDFMPAPDNSISDPSVGCDVFAHKKKSRRHLIFLERIQDLWS